MWQPIAEVRLQPPENLQPGDSIQAAIKPPTVRHGIDMAADEQRSLRCAAQGGPEITRRIVVNLDARNFLDLALKPLASSPPRRSKGDTLRAILITREGAEFLQFLDRALRIYGGIHRRVIIGAVGLETTAEAAREVFCA
jgi:hypothetical protein